MTVSLTMKQGGASGRGSYPGDHGIFKPDPRQVPTLDQMEITEG